MTDLFRPRMEPAATIYDAFRAAALKRKSDSNDEWQARERAAVLAAANNYASTNGLRAISMDAVGRAEIMAMGHVDFGAKWAYGVVDALLAAHPPHPDSAQEAR